MDEVQPTVPSRKRRRRWSRIAVFVLLLLAAVVVAAPIALAPFVQRKLETMVSNHLHARIEIGSLRYKFPYGITVRDAKFVTDASHDGVQLLTVKSLDLTLAKLPLGEGPIVIKSFTIVDPVVHIVRREDGSIVGSHLGKKRTESQKPKERMKLSDVLQLREFALSGATVVYEDRKHPEAKPMEWRDINARLTLTPQSGSRYAIHFAADSRPVARIEFTGAADVDSRELDLERLAIAADVQRDGQTSPLPAQFQRVLNELGIEGSVAVDVSGQMPLMHPKHGHFVVNVGLDRVRAQPQNEKWAMDELSAKVRVERGASDASSQLINWKVSDLTARGIGATVEVQSALGTIDLEAKTWVLGGLTGLIRGGEALQVDPSRRSVMRYVQSGRVEFEGTASGSYASDAKRLQRANLIAKLDRLSIYPPNFPEPIDAITGQVTLAGERAIVQNVTALYGNDRLTLNQMIVSLGDLSTRIDMLNILASAEFVAPAARYPGPLDRVMNELRPTGKIDIQGVAALYRRGKRVEPDYSLQIIPQGASVALLDGRMPITGLQGQITVNPRLIELKYVEGDSYTGKVALRGNVVPRMPIKYDGEFRAQDLDVALVAQSFGHFKPDGSPRSTGRANAKLRFRGEVPKTGAGDPYKSIVAHGRLQVKDGNFWSTPVLDGMVKEIKFAHDALTAGQAAAAFDVKDGIVTLNRAAINSSALGVQGTGTITIRQSEQSQMDLRLVAAPLGDWRRKMRGTGIPLISNVAGDIAGALQKIVNTATSQLLYEVRVTGRVGDPKIATVPAPLLTDSFASLFGVMMRGAPSDRLIEEIDGRDQDEPPRAQGSTSGGSE